jgi:phosphatidate phosphatase APP1
MNGPEKDEAETADAALGIDNAADNDDQDGGWRSQPRQVVGWALDRAAGWGPVPEVASAVRQIAGWVRPSGPLRIDGYRSYGTSQWVRIGGRILAGPIPAAAQPGEHQLKSAGRMAGRFLSAEVADVSIEICYDGVTHSALSDDEGYFSVDFEFDREATSGARWSMAQARVLDHEEGAGQWWPIEVLVVGNDVDRIIVSDVDDTILVNAVGAAARTVLTTVSGSELTREPVPGAAELYQQLSHATGSGAQCPIFYVSSSPWNLYDFLVAFLDHNQFPPGPLVLRDIGLNRRTFSDEAHRQHKVDSINGIVDRLPGLDVVLIGDSSLQDAHAFAEVIDGHPGRVVGAFLRDVGDEERTGRALAVIEARPDASPPIVLVEDMAAIAAHLGTS